MSVEVDDVVRASSFFGVGEFFLELFVGGGTQSGDVVAAAVFAEVLQEAIGHGAEGDVLRPSGAADDVEKADASAFGLRHGYETDVRIGLDADEGLHAQRDGRVGLRLVHQFPWNRGGFGDPGRDLNAQVRKIIPDAGPEILCVVIGPQDFPVKFLAALLHEGFDLLDLDFLNGFGPLEVVFEVPAELFLLLRGEGELNFCLSSEFCLVRSLQDKLDTVFVIVAGFLFDVERGGAGRDIRRCFRLARSRERRKAIGGRRELRLLRGRRIRGGAIRLYGAEQPFQPLGVVFVKLGDGDRFENGRDLAVFQEDGDDGLAPIAELGHQRGVALELDPVGTGGVLREDDAHETALIQALADGGGNQVAGLNLLLIKPARRPFRGRRRVCGQSGLYRESCG